MKKKLEPLTKIKLIYSGELLIIAIAVLIISILEFAGVFGITQRHHEIFNWVTIFGGTWIVIDFIWMLKSKKRQEKGCLLDKISLFPLGIYLISYDIVAFINYNAMPQEFYQYGIPTALMYIALAYIFQAIYHWYHPLPELLAELKKEQEEEEKASQTENKQENTAIASSETEDEIKDEDNKQ